MTPETLKKKLTKAIAPRKVKFSKDGDRLIMCVELPNNSAFYGFVPVCDDIDFDDIAAQCSNAEAKSMSDTVFLKNDREVCLPVTYEKEKTSYKHAIVPEGVERLGLFFDFMTELERVSLPQSLKEIGECAFYRCDALRTIDIPDNVELIGPAAFESCTSLNNVIIPKGVKELFSDTFFGCRSLKDITLQNGLERIWGGCFQSCTALESIEIPESVTAIGYHSDDYDENDLDCKLSDSFQGCKALKNIVLPKRIKELGTHPFGDCRKLTDSIIETDRFVLRDKMLIDKENHKLLTVFDCEELVVPDGITTIGRESFVGCIDLRSVTLPSTLSKIYPRAFASTSISFDKQVSNKLKIVNIPVGVAEIPDGAFWQCKDLEQVIIPNSVTIIAKSAFHCCENLRDIVLPDSVIELRDSSFDNCQNLVSEFS